MVITKETAEYVAGLSRLRLADDEIDVICRDLSKMLGFMDEINTTIDAGREVLHETGRDNDSIMRKDIVLESMNRDDLLANVPVRSDKTPVVPITVR